MANNSLRASYNGTATHQSKQAIRHIRAVAFVIGIGSELLVVVVWGETSSHSSARALGRSGGTSCHRTHEGRQLEEGHLQQHECDTQGD